MQQIFVTLIQVLQLLSALGMIVLVLLQHGKGADMGASFGGGSSGSLFGATGSANFLSRSTAALATIFFLCTLGLAFAGHSGTRGSSGGGTVLDRPAAAASGAAASAPAGVIPGTIPGAIPATPPAAPAAPAASAAPGTIPTR